MNFKQAYSFIVFLNLFQNYLSQSNSCTTLISTSGNFTTLTFSCNGSSYPILGNDYLTNSSRFDLVNFSNNIFTSIPIDLICRFSNAFHINLHRNQIRRIDDAIGQLKCLKNLKELNLSNNLIQLIKPSDLNDEMASNLEYFDLSYNLIDQLDPFIFLKEFDVTQTRFPKLKYFSISGNKLTEFDLLTPLSLPNSNLYFDASLNAIKRFKNTHKKSFRENPFIVDCNTPNRLVNLTTNKLSAFENEVLSEYGVESVSDFEIFILRISNYLISDQNNFFCKCPSFRQKSVYWFKQLININQNLSLFKQKCDNIDGRPFVFNYSCGVNYFKYLNFRLK